MKMKLTNVKLLDEKSSEFKFKNTKSLRYILSVDIDFG